MPKEAVSVAVDLVIFTVRDGALQVLLIERGIPPYKGQWALPGGFVLERETLEEAARRDRRGQRRLASGGPAPEARVRPREDPPVGTRAAPGQAGILHRRLRAAAP